MAILTAGSSAGRIVPQCYQGRMTEEPAAAAVRRLTESADRLDDLAEVAELMGDDDGSSRWRERAAARRHDALGLLDPSDPEI